MVIAGGIRPEKVSLVLVMRGYVANLKFFLHIIQHVLMCVSLSADWYKNYPYYAMAVQSRCKVRRP